MQHITEVQEMLAGEQGSETGRRRVVNRPSAGQLCERMPGSQPHVETRGKCLWVIAVERWGAGVFDPLPPISHN